MQTRHISSRGVTVSRLGFGAMRLPTRDGDIDDKSAEAMIDILMEAGVNYYDTAWFYHDGKSEPFLKKALVSRYPRDSFFLATKCPVSLCHSRADMEEKLDAQLARLGVDHIDFYLLHALSGELWTRAKAMDARAFLLDRQKAGQIKYIGFSFHDKNERFVPIVDDFDWQFVQIQLNYADWYQKKGEELYYALTDRKLPTIVMEPVRGGGLARLYPDMEAILKAQDPNASSVSWALRFCADLPGVDLILSGMSTPAQCRDNIEIFRYPRPLTDQQRAALEQCVVRLSEKTFIPCTGCRYCRDCPQGIDIATLFEAYNAHMGLNSDWPLILYLSNPSDKQAAACTRCGQCVAHCPQGLKVTEELVRAHIHAVRTIREIE